MGDNWYRRERAWGDSGQKRGRRGRWGGGGHQRALEERMGENERAWESVRTGDM